MLALEPRHLYSDPSRGRAHCCAVDLDASPIIESYLSLLRFTYDEFRKVNNPLEVSWENPGNWVWSPHGKAFAYGAQVVEVAKSFSGT